MSAITIHHFWGYYRIINILRIGFNINIFYLTSDICIPHSSLISRDRLCTAFKFGHHCARHNDVIMSLMASKITSLTIVYSTVYSVTYQRKHQSSASLAFVRGFHRGPVNSPHKGPVTRKMFSFNDVIMLTVILEYLIMMFGHQDARGDDFVQNFRKSLEISRSEC